MMDGNVFADTSKVCKAAMYAGLGNEFEGFTFKVTVKNVKKFEYKEGQNHGVKLTKNELPVLKGFTFDMRTSEQSCPNLKEKKSFISFDEMIKKV
jgi:hypothetical protein